MAKYGNFFYGTTHYGVAPRLAYSVEPMSLEIIDYQKTIVSWESPQGAFTRIRLLRSQSSYPETFEDGTVIWEEDATQGNVSRLSYGDGIDNASFSVALVPGKQVYYHVYLFTDQKVWVRAGAINGVMPQMYGVTSLLVNSLPRVFTSKNQSPVDEPDTDGFLYNFLDGIALTFEELMTYLDALKPNFSIPTPPSLIPAENSQYGVVGEYGLPIKNQKRLIREAVYMYTHKGTKNALLDYSESLTGYPTDIQISQNLLLSVQDSTFHGGIGNWEPVAYSGGGYPDVTLTTSEVPASVSTSMDTQYTMQITATNASSILLGGSSPITDGVPVNPGTDYTVSFQGKVSAGTESFTPSVLFYDSGANLVYTHTGSPVTLTTSWQNVSTTVLSSNANLADSSFAVIKLAWATSGTYFIDMVCMQEGDTASYDEARAINLTVSPNGTNYIVNPSFEVNTFDGWTYSNISLTQSSDVASNVYSSNNSATGTSTGNWSVTSNSGPVSGGKFHTGSIFAKANEPMNLTITLTDSATNQVIDSYTTVIPASSNWGRYSVTILAAPDIQPATMSISLTGTSATTINLDCAQLEQTYQATEYFDGALPSDYGIIWRGTANNSVSDKYYNFGVKVPRLAQTMNQWVPMNAVWRVKSTKQEEYNSFTV